MPRPAIFGPAIASAVFLLIALSGCGSKEDPVYERMLARRKQLAEEEAARSAVKKTPLQPTGRDGVLRGKVLYEGEPPIPKYIAEIDDHPDKDGCLKGGFRETHRPAWTVNKENKGVADVVVWLEPPANTYFPLTEKETNLAGKVVQLDQPHCAFVPHVLTLFPSYFDGTKQVKTGQQLLVTNSAPFAHSLQWNPYAENAMGNYLLSPNGGKLTLVLNPQPLPLFVGCGVHRWMSASLWIFDHPYHTVTREDGSFEIKNVPTGVELTFKAWHETYQFPFAERQITFTRGENPPLQLKITSPPLNGRTRK